MKTIFSDEELTAYLDGVIAPDIAAKISAAAKSDPALARRISGLTIDTGTLMSAFEPALGVARTRNLAHKLDCANSREVANRYKRPDGLWKAASYAATLVAGAAISWALLSPKPDWRIEVAHYQALYVPETLMSIAPDAARLHTEFFRASNALDLSLDSVAFSDVEGLLLRRAQVLGFEGATLVQIAFTLPDGSPVAFCILQKSGPATDLKSDSILGQAVASWSTPTHRFLAIGDTDITEIMAFAKQLQLRI